MNGATVVVDGGLGWRSFDYQGVHFVGSYSLTQRGVDPLVALDQALALKGGSHIVPAQLVAIDNRRH